MRRLAVPLVIAVALLAACTSSGSGPTDTGAMARRPTTTRHRPPRTTTTRPGATTTVAPAPAGGCRLGALPDPRCTPGELNPAVTPSTIHQTICVVGWTSTIRPSIAESSRLKTLAAQQYAIPSYNPADFEGDHLISLELGGAPDSIRNFWDEPHTVAGPDGQPAGSGVKDRFENYLRVKVCAGSMPLADAQRTIAGDWYTPYVAAGRP